MSDVKIRVEMPELTMHLVVSYLQNSSQLEDEATHSSSKLSSYPAHNQLDRNPTLLLALPLQDSIST